MLVNVSELDTIRQPFTLNCFSSIRIVSPGKYHILVKNVAIFLRNQNVYTLNSFIVGAELYR